MQEEIPESKGYGQILLIYTKKVLLSLWTHWFICGILLAILLAWLIPDLGKKGGYIRAEYTVKYVAICIIFFLSGLSLKVRELIKAISHWRLHILVQGINLLLIPVFIFGIVHLLDVIQVLDADSSLGNGLVILGSLPTTISTSVVLTESASGNKAAALFNSTLGTLLGLFITPAWLLLLLGTSTTSPVGTILLNLCYTVIIPLIAGQVIAYFFPDHVNKIKAKVNFGKINNSIILLIIFSTFCDTFSQTIEVDGGELALVIFVTIFLHGIIMVTTFFLSGITLPHLQFDRKDRVAILYCATQKTAAFGVPLINIMYEGDPLIGIKLLPLLIYHPTQILLASILSTKLKKWVERGESNVLNQPDTLNQP